MCYYYLVRKFFRGVAGYIGIQFLAFITVGVVLAALGVVFYFAYDLFLQDLIKDIINTIVGRR